MNDGTEEITLGAYSPNYVFPGVDIDNYPHAISFYRLSDYIGKGKAVSMNQPLIDDTYPKAVFKQKQKLEESGYKFKKFDYKDSIELIEFLKIEFGSGWVSNVQEALKQMKAEETLIIVETAMTKLLVTVSVLLIAIRIVLDLLELANHLEGWG